METTTITVSATEVKQKFQNNEDIVLINTLSVESFCSKHIPGSINIPANQVAEYAELVLPYKNQHLIAYCKSRECKKSKRAVEILEELGYKKVLHFEGGLSEWKEEGFKLEGSGDNVDDEC